MKMTVAAGYCSWSVKADEDPAADRLIMPGGAKLVIEQIDTPHDTAVRKHSEGIRKAEAAKTKRHDDFLQSQSQNDQPDHWLAYRANKGASKGIPRPSQQNESNSELAALEAQVGGLTARVDRQDGRLDNIEGTLTQQHREVMAALQALTIGSSASSAPPSGKRPSDMQASPLKADSGTFSEHKANASKGARKAAQQQPALSM